MNLEERFERKPRRTAINVGVSAIAVLAVIGTVGWGVGLVTNPFRQASRIVAKTIDADNVISNYEWFKRQHQDVLAIDVKLGSAVAAQTSFEAAAGPRENWRFDDRQEWNRLNAVALGLRSQRAAMVAEYNARTQMANRDLFRTSDLPSTLN